MNNPTHPELSIDALELSLIPRRRRTALVRPTLVRPTPRVTDWPSAPGTLGQGFLGGRWNRRDGTVYG